LNQLLFTKISQANCYWQPSNEFWDQAVGNKIIIFNLSEKPFGKTSVVNAESNKKMSKIMPSAEAIEPTVSIEQDS